MAEEMINTGTPTSEVQQIGTEQGVNLENPGPSTQPTTEKTFTQAQLNDIIQKRLSEEKQRYESNPGNQWLNSTAQRYGMTVEQYIEAVRQQEEQEQLNQLVQQNIPQEYAQEMLENRKFREQYQSEREASQKQTEQNKMYQEFLDTYPEVKPEQIPAEVWQNVQKGMTLIDAYVRYENKSLKDKLTAFETKQQTAQANQANAASSTGSVKGTGLPDSGYISKEVFDQNKGNQEWMLKNYDTIKKSMSKWRR